jgi:type VI secretion system Hcp family effector
MTSLVRICATLCLFLLLSNTPASAIIAVYIAGRDQGHIKGDLTIAEERDNIEATSFSSSIYIPYDPATGRPSGRTQYSPIMLSKIFDSATVPMIQALNTNERLEQVIIRLYTQSAEPVLYYVIELQSATLVSFEQNGVSGSLPPTELWGFTFDAIMWTDVLEARSTEDTWADVVAAELPPAPSSTLTLLPPLPNPADMESVIRFDLPIASHATLDVYDLKGRRVSRLFDASTSHERTVVRWNGRDKQGEQVANGIYLVRLRWPKGEVTQRVTFMR